VHFYDRLSYDKNRRLVTRHDDRGFLNADYFDVRSTAKSPMSRVGIHTIAVAEGSSQVTLISLFRTPERWPDRLPYGSGSGGVIIDPGETSPELKLARGNFNMNHRVACFPIQTPAGPEAWRGGS
jgi:hypothetical protein